MRYLNLLLLPLLLLISCSEEKPKEKIKLDKHLSEKDFYQLFKVRAFQEDREEFRSKAKEVFYLGINSFKNKGDLDSGLFYLENSIRIYPTANAYYELGNVLKDRGFAKEAIQSYQVAEGLGYEPLGSVLIQISRAFAVLQKYNDAGDYLTAAIQGGFTNRKLIEYHPDYKKFVETWQYSEHLKDGFSGLTEPEQFAWFQFKKQFPIVSLPLKVQTDLCANDFEKMSYISYDYETYIPGMRDAKFAREVGVGHYFYANINETEQYVACLYIARDENFYYDEDSEYEELYSIMLCTFDEKGKIIDLKKIAGREEYDDLHEEAEIDLLGNVAVAQYKINYQKNPEKDGYINNPVLSREKVGVRNLMISPSGKIVDVTPTLANTVPEDSNEQTWTELSIPR